ncbi:MAG: hypothetical protein ABR522_08240 [Marinobacter sp.]
MDTLWQEQMGANAGGEHDQVGLRVGVVAEVQAQAGVLALDDPGGGFLCMNLHTQLFDLALEQAATHHNAGCDAL